MNIKNIYPIVLILFLSQSTFGEIITISGKVLRKNQNALQYVSIGIINKTIGTVSNENGEFNLEINQNQITDKDSIRFSMIGYESKSFLLKDICDKQNLTITLAEKIEFIPEAVITSKRLKTKVKGTTHFPVPLYVRLANSELSDQNLGSAIARSLNINHENTIIEDIRFFMYSNFDTTTIRINFYSIKKRKPYKSLLAEGIYTQIIGKNQDWIHVDLKPYHIVVNDDIIIALEWVGKSQNGSYLFFPLARPSIASHYYKVGSQNKWEQWPGMSCLMEITLKY